MRKDSGQLSDAEREALNSSSTPKEVRQFVARQKDMLGTRAGAYRKVADAARAEREALLEITALGLVKNELRRADEAEREARTLRAGQAQLEAVLARKDEQIARLTARPALAEHSGSPR